MIAAGRAGEEKWSIRIAAGRAEEERLAIMITASRAGEKRRHYTKHRHDLRHLGKA